MGVVFRARDEQEGRDVAIKILHAAAPDASRRLQREARATVGLDPSRVAQVYDVGETEGGRAFLVMAYVEGRTLRDALRAGAIDMSEALRILREIAITLAQAHKGGLVHRDVKPDNVMLRRSDGGVVLLDFGIVKHLDRTEDVAQRTTQLTSEGTMIGTPAYLAPEQALGREVTPAVDQFALAVTAFELLTGRLPWSATDMTRMLAQLLADAPPPPSTLSRKVPAAFDPVLARALSKSPEERFPTIEAFSDALDAAERGETMRSPASQTIGGPVITAGTLTSPAATTAIKKTKVRPRGLRPLALSTAAVLALVGGVSLVRGRQLGARTDASRTSPSLAPSGKSPLACPIFAVDGVPDATSRLGAAAASLACARAKWYLGGSDEEVLVPAALLDAPVQPRQDLADVFRSTDGRARTLQITQARGLPSLDGTVTRARDSWRVDLFVRAPGGGEIARSVGTEAPYLEPAIRDAVIRLWQTPPMKPRPIDPEVARWTAYPDIETGLLELDLNQTGAADAACATVRTRGPALGRAYYYLSQFCPDAGPPLDAGAPALDESSAPALVTSIWALTGSGSSDSLPDAEWDRIVLKLRSTRASEGSRFGRASLGRLEGGLLESVHQNERAYAAELSALSDDPLLLNAWYQLLAAATGTGASDNVRMLASTWFPQEPDFLQFATRTQSDLLEERLRDTRLAYVLEPSSARTLSLGLALAEAGRGEEVRALTVAIPIERSAPEPTDVAALLAFIDLHDAMLERARGRLEEVALAPPRRGRVTAVNLLTPLASILGLTEATGARWAASFMQLADAEAKALAQSYAATLPLCMNAGSALAGACLSRVEKLAGALDGWGVGGDLMLRGAKRFALGDLRGAVDAWRPIVAGPNEDLALLLPTAAFDHVGEHDLAARIDARKSRYRQFAGVSEADPREARRAFERGDRARAKELAKGVVQAWEVADGSVPAVAEMRALLAKIGE
jgi:predicted Ser/Thr protein kinase